MMNKFKSMSMKKTLALCLVLCSCTLVQVNSEYVPSLDLVQGEPTNINDYINDSSTATEHDVVPRELVTISNDVESPHIHDEDYWNAMANQPLPEKSCGVYTSSVEIVGVTVDSMIVKDFDACCVSCHDRSDCDLFTFAATTASGGLGSGRCFLKSNDLPWTFFMDADENFISSVADKGIMGTFKSYNGTSDGNVTLGTLVGKLRSSPSPKTANGKSLSVKYVYFIINGGSPDVCALSCLIQEGTCLRFGFSTGENRCLHIVFNADEDYIQNSYKFDTGYKGQSTTMYANIVKGMNLWYGCNNAVENVNDIVINSDIVITRREQRSIYTLNYPENDVDYPGYEPVDPDLDLDVSVTCQKWCQSQVLCGGFTQDGSTSKGGTCTFYGKDSTSFNPNSYKEQEVQYQYERRCGFNWPFDTAVLGGIIASGVVGLMLIMCGIWFGVKRWRNKRNQEREGQHTINPIAERV